MKNRLEVRYFLFTLSLASLMWLAACSYRTNFVVVNASDHTIEVRYKVKYAVDPSSPGRGLNLMPAVKKISEVDEQVPWEDLSGSRFTVEPDSRTVVVSLGPGRALRVEQLDLV